MGYRSEVRCLIYGTKDALDAYITLKALIDSSVLQDDDFKQAMTRYTIDAVMPDGSAELHVLDFHVSGWKWCEDYPEVKAFEKFMIEAESHGLQYEFIRIGEEYDNVNKHYSSENEYFLGVTCPEISENFITKGERLPLSF